MTNNSGPRILACGMPDFTVKGSDKQSLIDILNLAEIRLKQCP